MSSVLERGVVGSFALRFGISVFWRKIMLKLVEEEGEMAAFA